MPDRMCIVTREVKDEAHLLRFVRAPDGTVTPDLQRNLPGRGVWVSLLRNRVEEACRKGIFARGLDGLCVVPEGLAETVSQLLRKQAVSAVSLARKAGDALSGNMKVEEALRRGPVAVLLHAAGAGEDGCAKLNRLARPGTLIFTHFRPDELDLAFGRPNVIHAAVAAGGLADRLTFHVHRLAEYDGLTLGQIGH
jgi:uncharacterized protein